MEIQDDIIFKFIPKYNFEIGCIYSIYSCLFYPIKILNKKLSIISNVSVKAINEPNRNFYYVNYKDVTLKKYLRDNDLERFILFDSSEHLDFNIDNKMNELPYYLIKFIDFISKININKNYVYLIDNQMTTNESIEKFNNLLSHFKSKKEFEDIIIMCMNVIRTEELIDMRIEKW